MKVVHINHDLEAVKQLSAKLTKKWRARDKKEAEQLYFIEKAKKVKQS
jgi:hypothetical protein